MKKELKELVSKYRMAICVAILASSVAACTVAGGGRTIARTGGVVNYEIVIEFDEFGCPTGVVQPLTCALPTPAGFCVAPAQTIKWVSEPPGNGFEIYFDPFVGRPYSSNPPLETTPPYVIRPDTLDGEYKYGVFGVGCTSPGDAVLDPTFRVER